MTATAANAGERRRYWFSIAALAVVLPAAILVHTGDTIREWLRDMRDPIAVESGALQRYAGADWRLTGLARLPGSLPKTAVVLAEFEATVDDPAQLAENRCQVALTDDRGRRWQPAFLPESAVHKAKPAAADKPHCGLFEGTSTGDTIMMAESFVVPEDAKSLALSVSLSGALPAYLLFR
ncbi:hypothetical protein [Mesorhizobium sp.]|uniref:hypothetical protein n=1 Tax=Mesorhizobium sp. TaxID=1871066 RepID=UPI001215AEF5|nr:hypothetical protein [Mesorhizobium sp.]TIO11246.1 MAG: hypothetical protein E5X88_01735 [Mesorhizobium sp.]TIO33510.1 MAG: hypothetical protein E5X89_14920 [Mesorhizobium sp.]TIP14690.1 MAG: hypothetical protein E5X73_01480 [Mesorhizobium sp.]